MDRPTESATVEASRNALDRAGRLITSGFADRTDHPFADDFVFHFFNRQLPDLNGDHHGIDGIAEFFGRLGSLSPTGFRQQRHWLRACGDELIVTFVTNTVGFGGTEIDVDAVVVWRVVDGRIREAWDIPAVNTVRPATSAPPGLNTETERTE